MVTIRMPGQVIVENRAEIKEDLHSKIDPQLPFLLLDFEDTEYVDSSGMGMLYGISERLENLDGALLVRGLNEDIAELFRLTKMDTCFFIQRGPRPRRANPADEAEDGRDDDEPKAGSDFLRLEK